MLSDALQLPLYVKLEIGILIGSFLIMLLAIVGGAVGRRVAGERLIPSRAFYPGVSFPTKWDTLFAILFIGAIVLLTAKSALNITPPGKPQSLALLIVIIFTGLQYLPMILRIYMLPRPDKHLAELNLPPLPQCDGWGEAPRGRVAGIVRDLGLGMLMTFCTMLFAGLFEWSGIMRMIMETTDCPMYQNIILSFTQGTTFQRLVIAFGAIVIAPIGEECCFRGFLYNIVRRYAGRPVAAISTSLLFAAVHISLVPTVPLFVFALLQCWLYEKTKTLRTPIIAHAIYNTAALVCTMLLQPTV